MNVATINRFEVTVPAVDKKIIHARGDFLLVESASSSSGVVARLEAANGPVVATNLLMRAGAAYKKLPAFYDKIVLQNTSAAAITLVLWTGEGDVSLNVISGSVAPELSNVGGLAGGSNPDVVLAAATEHTLSWEDIDPVHEIHVQNDAGSAGEVRLGSGVIIGDDKGLVIQPGETYVMRVNPMELGVQQYKIRAPTGLGGATVRYFIFGRSKPGTSSP